MLTAAEQKLIKRYHLLPMLGKKTLWTIPVLSGEWIMLSMLDDLVFHNPVAFTPGWIVYIALVVGLVAFCCYAYLSAVYGMRKPAWKAIEKKRTAARKQAREHPDAEKAESGASAVAKGAAAVAAGQMVASGLLDGEDIVSAAYGAGGATRYLEATSGIARNAARVARDFGLELPDPKRAHRLMLAAVLVILALTYGVHFLGRMNAMSHDRERAAATLSQIERTFEGEGFYVVGADSAEEHDSNGYSIYGNLFEMGDDTTRVGLVVDNDGVVQEVAYTLDINPELSLEENLAQAEEHLACLQAAVAKLDVPFAEPGLAAQAALPDAFTDAFLAGSIYEDIFFNPDDLGSVDGAYLWCTFDTRSKEDWIDGLWPSIWLRLETDW